MAASNSITGFNSITHVIIITGKWCTSLAARNCVTCLHTVTRIVIITDKWCACLTAIDWIACFHSVTRIIVITDKWCTGLASEDGVACFNTVTCVVVVAGKWRTGLASRNWVACFHSVTGIIIVTGQGCAILASRNWVAGFGAVTYIAVITNERGNVYAAAGSGVAHFISVAHVTVIGAGNIMAEVFFTVGEGPLVAVRGIALVTGVAGDAFVTITGSGRFRAGAMVSAIYVRRIRAACRGDAGLSSGAGVSVVTGKGSVVLAYAVRRVTAFRAVAEV